MKKKLFYGDNLDVLRKHIKSETVDLCYIDPPFNSKRNYNQIYNNIGKEDRAQAQAFTDTWTWDTDAELALAEIKNNLEMRYQLQTLKLINGLYEVLGKGSLLAYLLSMTQRIAEIHRVLKSTGSFYLHCDPTASHYLKLILDSIFCPQGGDFQNEIIWCYTAPTNTTTKFPKKHDVIFRYSKSSKEWVFNYKDISIPYSEETVARTGRGAGKEGLYGDNNPEEKHANRLKPNGKIPEDWWTIPRLQGNSTEKLGYPTQKPEALLERIIKASSNEGDVILDAYCGCGTTIAVAQRLKRNWIGIDITYQSISLILKRLSDSYGEDIINSISLGGIPEDMDSAIALANKSDDKTRKEFEKWAVLTYTKNKAYINDKKGGDGGIDGTSMIVDRDESQNQIYKKVIFSVKSNRTLSPTVIRDLFGTVEREGAAMGYLITLYEMENLVKESKKYGVYKNNVMARDYPKIQVINVKDILNEKRFDLPVSIEVVKSAEISKSAENPLTLFDQSPS